MKFTKPINREIEINGETIVVTLAETGVAFRLKGKRKGVTANWESVIGIARSESGEPGDEFLGIGSESGPQSSADPSIEPGIGRGATAGDGGFSDN